MVTSRSLELPEVIPSIGARFILQNYFKVLREETESSCELSSISTPVTTSNFSFVLAPQDITIPINDNKILNNIEIQEPIESSLAEESSVNSETDTILNNNHDDTTAVKKQRIETVDNAKLV